MDVIGDKLGGSGGAHWAISIHARGIHPGWLWPVDGFAFNKERKDPLDPYQNIFFEKDLRDIFNLVRFQEKDAHSSRIEIHENVCKLKEARQTRFCDK